MAIAEVGTFEEDLSGSFKQRKVVIVKSEGLVVVPMKRRVLLGDEFVEVRSAVVLGEDKSRKK